MASTARRMARARNGTSDPRFLRQYSIDELGRVDRPFRDPLLAHRGAAPSRRRLPLPHLLSRSFGGSDPVLRSLAQLNGSSYPVYGSEPVYGGLEPAYGGSAPAHPSLAPAFGGPAPARVAENVPEEEISAEEPAYDGPRPRHNVGRGGDR